MAQSESRDTDSLLPALKAGGFFASEATRIQTLTELQKQLLDTFEQLSREQLARMKQETELASDLAGKVTSASSMRDVMSAYQDWFFQADGAVRGGRPQPAPNQPQNCQRNDEDDA